MHPWLAVAVLFFSSTLWGLSWWPIKYLSSQGLDGVALILVSYGIVGLATLPVVLFQYSRWRQQYRSLLLILLIGGTANLTFAGALVHGDVVRVMALFYLLPVWGVLGGAVFLKERLTSARLLAVFLALGGAWLLLGGSKLLQHPPSSSDFLAILSGLAFAMNNLVFRATPSLPVKSKVSTMFIGCGIFAALPFLASTQTFPDIDSRTLLLAITFGFCGLLLATSATQWAVTQLETGRSSIVMVMELVAAVVSASLISGSTLSLTESIGGLLILSATIVEGMWGTTNTSETSNTSDP